jgi:hypothetical protein
MTLPAYYVWRAIASAICFTLSTRALLIIFQQAKPLMMMSPGLIISPWEYLREIIDSVATAQSFSH